MRSNKPNEISRAFNEGSDARIDGRGLDCNRYGVIDREQYIAWRNGWESADAEWGVMVKGRWSVRNLPSPHRNKSVR